MVWAFAKGGVKCTTLLQGERRGSLVTDDRDREQEEGQPPGDASGADDTVPEEQPIEQQIVPFLGDELAAAMTTGGAIYITFPGMCTALGLNVRGQTQRIQRTRSLGQGLRRIPLETRGGVQRINCLRVDKIALWLAGVQTKQIRPQFRAKIEAYQDELAPVATQVFLRVLGIKPTQLVPASATADPAVHALVEQIDELSGVVNLLREHLAALLTLPDQVQGLAVRLDTAVALLESLAARQDTAEGQLARIAERTQRLTPAHQRAVQEEIGRMVRATTRLPPPAQLTYPIIYGRLKHRFRAGSYGEIADERFEAVMAFLRDELRRATGDEAGPAQGNLF